MEILAQSFSGEPTITGAGAVIWTPAAIKRALKLKKKPST